MSKILFTNVTGLTMDDQKTTLENAFVLVEGRKIVGITSTRPEGTFDREISCEGKVMLPGLVNAHTHVPMTLLRGLGGGNNLQDWLHNHIFPAEARLTPRAIKAGTGLAMADLLAVGVTSFADMYYFCDEMAEVIEASGMNVNISRGITQFAPVEDPSALESVKETKALVEKWHGKNDGQFKVDLSIHGEYTSFLAPTLWDYMASYSQEKDLPLHIHVSETKAEHKECKERHGKTPLQVLDDHGLWERGGLAAHCVWTEEGDWEIMAKKNISAVHNPVSNLKLGSGVAPLGKMLQAGVNVAMGTDSVASNNNHDLLEEVKLTALLHNGVHLNPTEISSYTSLDMGTRRGGIALKRKTGQITVGYDADIILLDVMGVAWTPMLDMVENTVFSSCGKDVCLTMCGGTVCYENGIYHTLDVEAILKEVKEYAVPVILGQHSS